MLREGILIFGPKQPVFLGCPIRIHIIPLYGPEVDSGMHVPAPTQRHKPEQGRIVLKWLSNTCPYKMVQIIIFVLYCEVPRF